MIKQFIKRNVMTILSIFSIVGGMYLYWFYSLDGVYFRKPIIFYYDTQNIKTDKDVYSLGETVYINVSFCKVRETYSSISWVLIDGRITQYSPKSGQLPVGCYFNTKYPIAEIPIANYLIGDTVHFEGDQTTFLDRREDGRIIRMHFKTKDFKIVE